MDTQEAYHELGLSPSASDAQLKAAWRRLVAAWHPDRNAAAEAGRRMQSINKAYQHVRQLRDGGAGAAAAWTAPEPAPAAPKAHAQPPVPPAHTHVRQVRLSLEDAILGCTRTLSGRFVHSCGACQGKGVQVKAVVCVACRGSGAVRRPALFSWFGSEESCADCGGDGRQRAPCAECDGSGEQAVHYRRRVRFPAGLRAGHVLSVPAARQGGAELGLELQVEFEPHPFFVLDAEGVLRCEMPVNGYAWMAGRWIEIPTPDGLQQMRLNRDALVYRLGGQGFPAALRGARGDYIVKVVPVFPGQLDAEQESLLNALIASVNRSAQADASRPLGQWERGLQRWNASHKKPARDE